jgi:hypothetical protein
MQITTPKHLYYLGAKYYYGFFLVVCSVNKKSHSIIL